MSSFRPYEIRSELYPPGDPINYEDPKNPIDYTCVNLYRDYDKNIQSYANKCAEFSIELDNLTKPANFIQHTREILTHKKEAIFPTQITPYDIDERYAHENPNNRLGRLEKQEILRRWVNYLIMDVIQLLLLSILVICSECSVREVHQHHTIYLL